MNPEARGAQVRLSTVINPGTEWKAKDNVVPIEEQHRRVSYRGNST